VRGIRVWARLLGLQRAVVEDVRMGGEGEVIVSVRPGCREPGSLRDLPPTLPGV
jgi:hypothetical protein